MQMAAVAKESSPKVACMAAANFSSQMEMCACPQALHQLFAVFRVLTLSLFSYVGYYADGRRINPPGVKSFAEVQHLQQLIVI
jgi:hypothetical protein